MVIVVGLFAGACADGGTLSDVAEPTADNDHLLLRATLPFDVAPCVADASSADPLLEAAVNRLEAKGTIASLPGDEIRRVSEQTIACLDETTIVAGLQAFEFLPETGTDNQRVGECFGWALLAPSGPDAVTGLMTLNRGVRPAEIERLAAVEAFTQCVPLHVWLVPALTADPMFADAFDEACLEGAHDPVSARPWWDVVLGEPGTVVEDMDPTIAAAATRPFYACGSLGQMMANVARDEGTDLRDETVACLRDHLDGYNLGDAFLGARFEDQVRVAFGRALGDCATPAEIAQMEAKA